jgi:hypothetical protein
MVYRLFYMLARVFIGWHRLVHIVRFAKPISNNNSPGNISEGKFKLLLTSRKVNMG